MEPIDSAIIALIAIIAGIIGFCIDKKSYGMAAGQFSGLLFLFLYLILNKI